MKISMFFLVFTYPLFLLGQIKIDTAKIMFKHDFKISPTYFLDSNKTDISKTYFDLKEVKNINVIKDTSNNSQTGKVYITTKTQKHNWLKLSDLKNPKTITDSSQPKIHIIDGTLISDTSNVKIEATLIKSIEILNMAEANGIYIEGRPKTIFVITTKRKNANLKKKNNR